MDEWTRWRNDEEKEFVLGATEELAWITGNWLPIWSAIACSTGADLRHIVNQFANYVAMIDRRLRDDWAA